MNYTKEQQELIDKLKLEDRPEVITNPFSGRSCELEPLAVALYDYIKGCEAMKEYKEMGLALGIFAAKWPSEYYTLLD